MTHTTTRPALFWALIAIPVLIHFFLLYANAVNAPRLDDFPEILTFLPDWHAASDLNEKVTVLFRDYQNHRYVLYHALLVYFDHINFRTATIIGNLPLLALCVLMMFCVRTHPQKKILWLITPLLVFNLQTWRAMFWGPLGTTNLLYPTLSLLACWLATRGTVGLAAAACTAILLTLSHGSGPLLFPVIAGYLWIKMRAGKLSHLAFMHWMIISSVSLTLYFVLFPLNREAGYSSHSTDELLLNFISHTGEILTGFLAVLGSHLLSDNANQASHHHLAAILGALELIWLGILVKRGYLRHSPALLMWLVFLLLTTASIASGRVAYAGAAQAMQSHYKLLNGIFIWFGITATLQWIHDNRSDQQTIANTAAIMIPTGLYLCALWIFLTPMQTLQRDLLQDARQWQQSGKLQHIETQLYVKQPNKKIKAAVDGGFYNPEE